MNVDNIYVTVSGARGAPGLGVAVTNFGTSFVQAPDAPTGRALLNLGGAATLDVGIGAGFVAGGDNPGLASSTMQSFVGSASIGAAQTALGIGSAGLLAASTDGMFTSPDDVHLPTTQAVKTLFSTALQGFHWLTAPAACASTANLTLSGEQTIDGVLTSASRVLVKNQTTQSQNGVYVTGSGAWTRATDNNSSVTILQGACFVVGGSTQANTQWQNNNSGTITVGTTAITFTQIGAAVSYTNGTGLNLTGNAFSVKYGTTSGTAAQGNDSRIVGAAQTGTDLVATSGSIASVAIAATTDISAVASSVVMLTGSLVDTSAITSFGAIAARQKWHCIVAVGAGPARILPGSNIALASNYASTTGLILEEGDEFDVIGTSAGVALVYGYARNNFQTYYDARLDGGAGNTIWRVGADPNTAAPDFGLDQNDTRTKGRMKSLLLADYGDTCELGFGAGAGTASSPVVWTGNAPHAVSYSWSPYLNFSVGSSPNEVSYGNGRYAQEYYFQTETPTSTGNYLRGGGKAFAVERKNRTVGDMNGPDAVYIVGGDASGVGGASLVSLGRASWEDSGNFRSGFNYGSQSGGASANYDLIFNFNTGWAYRNTLAVANNVSAASDMHSHAFAVEAFRLTGAFNTGWDRGYDSTLGLVEYTVASGALTGRWYTDSSGNKVPVTDRGVSLGAAGSRILVLSLDNLDISRNSNGPAVKVLNTFATFSGNDLCEFDVSRASSASFNFFRSAANNVTQYKVQGDGQVYSNGYNAISDRRLKANIKPLDPGASGAFFDKIELKTWTLKASGTPGVGLIAQEAIAADSRAGDPGRGRPGRKGFVPASVDTSFELAMCMAEIKSLRTELKGALARVAALEAA